MRMNKIENGAYSKTMHEAVTALAAQKDSLALDLANKAMDIALYHMMEPVDSYYVKQAVAIRNSVFTMRRYDGFVANQKGN
ncbi:hypothetical protein PP935_gp097 [Rhizobium phage RHph_N34]|uniref:Uncharacterized protein n=1 Tax=Rhizobium phage RHph_N34 TaxID=2509586 RepID=A0A7S5RA13_9CAUD|nr:hypothetical protein PP935_gp097 [Rhizobium phage RHph_N34]QIG73872.1 hypothetical protein EVC06_097 [Rhizobium phage RHph_N34]